jgi:SAM-dependent methyltransferase
VLKAVPPPLTSLPFHGERLRAYERIRGADDAKKSLEMGRLRRIVAAFTAANPFPLRSLDVGSATGRYPRFFSRLGFEASGYDISADAVSMSRLAYPHVTFEQRDILAAAPEHERYAVITCMMGTLNHIPRAQHERLLAWVGRSLRPGGIFIGSAWNASCPHLSCIGLYSSDELGFLLANAPRDRADIERLAARSGLVAERVEPVCLLPDDYFEDWRDVFGEERLHAFDEHLARRLDAGHAQMLVFVLRKPARPQACGTL